MNITCTHCGAKFAGKPEYRGRRIRCTKCQEVFRVPDERVDDGELQLADDNAYAASVASNVKATDEIDEWNVPDNFEYKMEAEEQGTGNYCPYCGEPGDPRHVLCLKCGYHRGLKKKIDTQRGEAEEEKQEAEGGFPTEIDFGVVKLPIWPIAVAVGVFFFATLLLYLVVPVLAAVLLMLVGLGLTGVGNVWILVIAWSESPLMALAIWFIPCFWWYYVVTRIEDLWMLVGISLLGCLMCAIGIGIIGPGDVEEFAMAGMAWMQSRMS